MKLPVFLMLALLVGPTKAHSTPAFVAPLADQSLLLDVAATAEGIIAVGERGHILLSSDASNWQQQTVPVSSTLTSVTVQGQRIWAVGHDAVIIASVDNGHSWQIQNYQPELEKPLMDVLFLDENHGLAIGAYGLFYRTTDGGANWQREPHIELLDEDDIQYLQDLKQEDESLYEQELSSILPHFNRLSRAGETLYLAGEAGLLAASQDQGRSWQRMEIDYYGSFFDIRQTTDNRLLAAGLRGHLFEYQAQDGWQELPTNMKSSLNSIVPLADGHTLVVGNNGYLIWLNDELQVQQTEEEKAVLNALPVGDKVIAVTETGIRFLQK
ncbi:WD40/YVTN/BNR-like repeat-containing protein [Bowmanella denitrificans]|uniref:WD40/YVTN/BNR-like repeat-containing protein n=1 Tax=Bowmanella denitrificans TaxID=366582 RepID=UPI000C9AB572|nr:YCF48-related protein [Bowmanella denitrificans]